MANISIGGVTPSRNPTRMTVIRKDKASATKKTYGGVAYFGWPASIVGKEIDIEWTYLRADEFASLDVLYQADSPIVFDPQDGSGLTYNVNLVALDGEYHLGLDTGSGTHRKNVKLTLLIMSQV